MSDKILEDARYYENWEYSHHFQKLMNKETTSFDLEDGRYSEDNDFSAHYKKVFSGNREDYDFPEKKYYEDEPYNARYIEILSTDGNVLITPSSAEYDKRTATDDLVFSLSSAVLPLVNLKNGNTKVAKSNYSVNGTSLTLNKAYLDTLTDNNYTFTATFDNGETGTFDVNVFTSPAPTPTDPHFVDPLHIDFVKDGITSFSLNKTRDVEIIKIEDETRELNSPADYTMEGKIAFTATYCNSLSVGAHKIVLTTSTGEVDAVEIDVTEK